MSFNILKNKTLKTKLFFPNILYILLAGTILFFFFNSNVLIQNLSKEQKTSNQLSDDILNTALDIKGYINKEISFDDLEKEYKTLLGEITNSNVAENFQKIWKNVVTFQSLRKTNLEIEKEVFNLADNSIKRSNEFIDVTSRKLADKKQRSQITTLERLVLKGANTNTSSNYQLEVLFGRLKEDLNVKGSILQFLETLIKNIGNDVKNLEGTPFEQSVRMAQKADFKIKELILAYINNVEKTNQIQTVIFDEIDKNIAEINQMAMSSNEKFFSQIKTYFRYILIIMLVTSFLGIFISFVTARSLSEWLNRIAIGLSNVSEQVASSSKEVSTLSQLLAEASSEQAASIEETSSSMEIMSSMTKQNAENSSHANGLMKDAKKVVTEANESMGKLTVSMDDISKASEETSKIIKTIDEIAFQTNLLALNAAVEAARAGEAGAGFAVVADEVRNLAMRAADAAKNTALLIESTVNKINDGSDLVSTTNEAFSKVAQSTVKVGELVAEISEASQEQSEGIGQINIAIAEMDKVVQQNSENSENSATASEETEIQIAKMRSIINELTFLVSGTNGNETNRVPSPAGRLIKTTDKSKNTFLAPEKKMAIPQKNEIRPNQVIPFDENEEDNFQDF
ncbi:methyl-accepting chemotaxis protein [Desulfobacula phenolica]|uniref:Methyl-accepting chemotaxis protein n=1 Tax=Desulfobacula phenolica TaxID=90732 RepID=A0A1H2EFR0_9BACT|nr:methyl-accepting chemotaxis protein [Desulfobacula phenolica]SDT93992.1 methyl-accepting chemotaxis protein [Desulfobacula phenolica]